MSIFGDSREFQLVHHFKIGKIYSRGGRETQKREDIRRYATEGFPSGVFNYRWYGFHIKVNRNMLKKKLDLENVPKLIVEAFSGSKIEQDHSEYLQLELYPDDHLGYIKAIQAEGELTLDEDDAEVWIFGKK